SSLETRDQRDLGLDQPRLCERAVIFLIAHVRQRGGGATERETRPGLETPRAEALVTQEARALRGQRELRLHLHRAGHDRAAAEAGLIVVVTHAGDRE